MEHKTNLASQNTIMQISECQQLLPTITIETILSNLPTNRQSSSDEVDHNSQTDFPLNIAKHAGQENITSNIQPHLQKRHTNEKYKIHMMQIQKYIEETKECTHKPKISQHSSKLCHQPKNHYMQPLNSKSIIPKKGSTIKRIY